jgi:D-apionate oxidoisomerase
MAEKVALIGAGGKMGSRVTDNFLRMSDADKRRYDVMYCEKAESGIERLKGKGLSVTPSEQAVPGADLIVLAVPDALIGVISGALVPLAKPGATVVFLDPAAAALGEVAMRDDLNYVACHPCHPPMFFEQPTPEARADFFGGIAATQDIVIALVQGSEAAFESANNLCIAMFAPVRDAHRITVEQMAVLEPAMAEVVAASAACLMKDAMDEAVKAGVPREAAHAFMMGHAQIALAIAFGAQPSPFSDAAKVAIRWGSEMIFKPDWRKVFEPDQIKAVLQEMIHPG